MHLEAAVRYTSSILHLVFQQVATMADYSAALLYQNDVAMAQSLLPNAELATQKNAAPALNQSCTLIPQ